MEFKEIAAVSGKSGLFKILKPTRNGVVLESLDNRKEKLVISSNTKVSILKDISMYTTSAEGNKPLSEIMINTKEVFGNNLPVNSKSSDIELRKFFLKVVPDFDDDRVYTSDIKKMVTWYGIITETCPEALLPEVKEVEDSDDKSKTEEIVSESIETTKPKKAATKKAKETEEASVEEVAATAETKTPKVKKAKS